MKIKILIASHKLYRIPLSDIYFPIRVGSAGNDDCGFNRDDIGDNISELNPNFCELTGVYWAWKNLDSDYIGLVHYRRHFAGKDAFVVNGKKKKILSEAEILKLLSTTDVVLPKKRNYFIETLYSHYAHTMYVAPLEEAGRIIQQFYPTYYSEFEKLKVRKSAHMFNMFVMKKDIFDSYCEWLFDILFKLKDKICIENYDAFHARCLGRVSELLLDVYINANHIKYKELKVVYTEKVNWIKKIINFLKAKYAKKKYSN